MSTVDDLQSTLNDLNHLDREIRLSLLGPEVWRMYRRQGLNLNLLLDMHDVGPVRNSPSRVRGAVSTLRVLSLQRTCEEVSLYIDQQVSKLSAADRFEFDSHEVKYLDRYWGAFGRPLPKRDAVSVAILLTTLVNSGDEIHVDGYLRSLSNIWFTLCDAALRIQDQLRGN